LPFLFEEFVQADSKSKQNRKEAKKVVPFLQRKVRFRRILTLKKRRL